MITNQQQLYTNKKQAFFLLTGHRQAPVVSAGGLTLCPPGDPVGASLDLLWTTVHKMSNHKNVSFITNKRLYVYCSDPATLKLSPSLSVSDNGSAATKLPR